MPVSPDNTAPYFEQIAQSIRAAVVAGIYRPGEPIPSIRAQATRLLINPNTIQRAYESLEREGLIESRKGLGMFVTADALQLARAGLESSLKETFSQGISLGRAAKLTRPKVDDLYRSAWTAGGRADGAKP